jgi:DNA-binding LacI/PurR family transcriptional regulator
MPFQNMAVSATRRLLNLCYNLELEVNYEIPIKLINRESVRNLKD